MDDGEFPTNDLLIDSKDRLDAGDSVGNVETRLASSSDENENQLDGDRSEVLTSSDSAMGMHEKVEQDNINNNENLDSGDCTPSCKEDETEKNSENFHMDIHREEKPVIEKWTDGKRPTCKKDSFRKSTGVPSVDTSALKENARLKATGSIHDDDADETNVNYQQKQQKQTLQSLFSMLREEFERMDLRILPLCLHQIAEAYFQEEEYEKAMKFIQLERLYHEQLLANLSSIQEQWETKWKTAVPSTVMTLSNSAKGLNNEELENLAKLCTSHQEPLVSKHKLVTTEKSLGGNQFGQLMGSEDLKEREAAACDSDTETWPDIGPRKKKQRRERQMSESSLCKTDRLIEAASLQVAAGKDHMEEQYCNAESTLEPHAQSIGTVGRPCSDCLSSGDAGKDNSLQPREKQFSKDVAKIEDVAKEPGVELSGEPMVDTLVLTDADYIPPDLISKDENVQAERNVLRSKHSAGSTETARSQLENSALDQQQQKSGLGYEDGKSPQDRTASNICENMCYGSNKAPEHISPAHPKVYKGLQEMARQQEEEVNNEEPEDFFGRFLNGSIKDTEESLANLENQEDSETLPDIPLEQASYSSTEALLLDDSFSSLDELAKRIEIAEVAPAEGLVSILKKRDDSERKTLAQIQQRNPKRRVRFQEMEDTLDQDEGGGSCILLILLCIATVFLSVGGTALYCTFGDMESPVCTDFAANMDFYYTQMLQGVEELKHWITFT
ncbi:consortin [Dermochelys coriacea]|uniref:consortin n=1 Tax=Dermochelys coriacea TaxID=27794 RepID=UPI0018E8C4A3|nr:consortin [Dermochelys coriacea]XP_038249897.1 consortin [Dermochelys coriacea]XP_038249898.1 consortin [Dermochelys coriacea]XP_038249900.1 consortin [Dermochelys coriacea]XP_043368201.1 consortin [Dermochelys coriacea]XP_043368202.1 consortin [Dermochelys coriacea]XP_043368203.1 consortin [Dermochelys coriacea]XP_043368204.1 consortin [Dermochelys coriacea]XP_043368205.1 consortin [Dermochelys coriacea]XP_043368206.1 consortin [Dermochelys coriacea]XP_043368207.1 consortin [Dermochel